MTSEAEKAFHKALVHQCRLSKRQQGYVMGAFRDLFAKGLALYALRTTGFATGGIVPMECKAKFPEVKCSFSNQSIKPPVRYKPHICVRQGWWRVSPLNVKPGVEVAEQRWRKAHDFACKANEPTRQTLYARINDDAT